MFIIISRTWSNFVQERLEKIEYENKMKYVLDSEDNLTDEYKKQPEVKRN